MTEPIICACCSEAIYGTAKIISNQIVHERCVDKFCNRLDGRTHPCPQCKRSGKVPDPTGKTEKQEVPLAHDETPLCGFDGCRGCHECRNRVKSIDVPAQVTCPLCNGHGWCAEKPEPVTGIVGWQLAKGDDSC